MIHKPNSLDECEVQGLKMTILGTQGSGKTEGAKYLVRNKFKSPFVITPHKRDWENENCYLYITNYDTNIDDVFKQCIRLANEGKIDGIVVDEADMLFKNNHDMQKGAVDLFANHRHYPEGRGVSLVFISRRPQDLPTIFVESCAFLVVYKLEGDNVRKKMNSIRSDWGDKIVSDDFKYKSYEYYLKVIGEEPVLCSAITLNKATDKKAVEQI